MQRHLSDHFAITSIDAMRLLLFFFVVAVISSTSFAKCPLPQPPAQQPASMAADLIVYTSNYAQISAIEALNQTVDGAGFTVSDACNSVVTAIATNAHVIAYSTDYFLQTLTPRTYAVQTTLYTAGGTAAGKLLQISPDSTILVTSYNDTHFAIVRISITRTSTSVNAADDIFVAVPNTFYIDSLTVGSSIIAVTGVTVTAGGCVPTLLTFSFSGHLINAAQLNNSQATSFSPQSGLACTTLQQSLPLSLSLDQSMIAVGIAEWETIFIGAVHNGVVSTASVVAITNDPEQSGSNGFGSGVAFTSVDGSTLTGITTTSVNMFAAPYFNGDLMNETVSVIPNRLQRDLPDALNGVVSFNGSTVVFPLYAIPLSPAGQYFDMNLQMFQPCPAGTYRSATMISTAPCSYCPVGTYTASTGSQSCTACDDDAYCPTGSTYPFSNELINEEYPEYLPEFSALSFSTSFEDLLINGIFAGNTGSMICFYIVAGITFLLLAFLFIPRVSSKARRTAFGALSIYRHAAVKEDSSESEDEEAGEKPPYDSSCHGIFLWFNDSVTHTARHGEHEHGSEHGHAHHLSESQMEKLKERHKKEHKFRREMNEQILQGFFNVVLLLFVISSVLYSTMFLNNYQPHYVGESEDINRYATEQLLSVAVTDPNLIAGIAAINLVNASITLELYGYSGITCDNDNGEIQAWMAGCTLTTTNGPCNTTDTIYVETSDDDDGSNSTCTITFLLIQGTLLANAAQLTFRFPPSLHVQAMRLGFTQDPLEQSPGNYGTGATTFWENLLHPQLQLGDDPNNLTTIANVLAPRINRVWEFGIVANSFQDTNDDPPHFYYTWYNTVTESLGAYFPNYSPDQILLDNYDDVQVIIVMNTDTIFRSQSVTPLIQMKAAFLTILLGLIAIFHLVHFATEVTEVGLKLYHKAQHAAAMAKLKKAHEAHKAETRKSHSDLRVSIQGVKELDTQTLGMPNKGISTSYGRPTSPLLRDNNDRPHPPRNTSSIELSNERPSLDDSNSARAEIERLRNANTETHYTPVNTATKQLSVNTGSFI